MPDLRQLFEQEADWAIVSEDALDRTLHRVHRRERHRRLVAALVAVVVFSAGGAWGMVALLAGKPPPRRPAAAACSEGWRQTQAPSPGNFGAQLASVAAISPNDLWAVGSYSTVPAGYSPPPRGARGHGPGPPETSHPLVEHWDGSRWSLVPAPNAGVVDVGGGAWLRDIAAIASNDVWAVGGDATGAGGLIEHWDGSRWRIVSSAAINLIDTTLVAVSGSSANDVWAVGTGGGQTDFVAVEHWDGSRWTLVSTPTLSTSLVTVSDVFARSPSDAWLVGQAGGRALIEHWDGDRWSVLASPDVRSPWLSRVVAFAPNDAWAVGTSYADVEGNGPTYPLVERWNGRAWSVVPIPLLNGQGALVGLAASGPRGLRILGGEGAGSGQGIFLSFDGQRWTRAPAPPGFQLGSYRGLTATKDARVWYVGYAEGSPNTRVVAAFLCA